MPENESSCQGTLYTVRPGDTLWGLCRRYGIGMSVMRRVNPHLTFPVLLMPGQVVCLPIELPATPEPPKEDPGTAQPPVQPKRCPGFSYSLRAGDTIEDLARRYMTTDEDLRKWNPSLDPAHLQPGTVICIPEPER